MPTLWGSQPATVDVVDADVGADVVDADVGADVVDVDVVDAACAPLGQNLAACILSSIQSR